MKTSVFSLLPYILFLTRLFYRIIFVIYFGLIDCTSFVRQIQYKTRTSEEVYAVASISFSINVIQRMRRPEVIICTQFWQYNFGSSLGKCLVTLPACAPAPTRSAVSVYEQRYDIRHEAAGSYQRGGGDHGGRWYAALHVPGTVAVERR